MVSVMPEGVWEEIREVIQDATEGQTRGLRVEQIRRAMRFCAILDDGGVERERC